MSEPRRCLITGGRGYLGSELASALRNAGWHVLVTSRNAVGPDEIAFTLGEEFPVDGWRGIDALVHCAYDFGPSSWEEIRRINVVGTRELLDQAATAGVKTIISISSISAFPDCKSLYGKAKLLIEQDTFARGGMALRPGLIYGGSDRGMYGKLREQAAKKTVPVIAGNPCSQYLVHIDDLVTIIHGWLDARWPASKTPYTIAHSEPWPLRKLLGELAISCGNEPRFVPVPWPIVWLGLKCFEIIGLPRGFKSDSVISIVNQNPEPDFGSVLASGIELRPLQTKA